MIPLGRILKARIMADGPSQPASPNRLRSVRRPVLVRGPPDGPQILPVPDDDAALAESAAVLQLLNDELTEQNRRLSEALERQKTISGDLQDILYSTDVATLLLDPKMNIRFFTPATKALFGILPGDVGR